MIYTEIFRLNKSVTQHVSFLSHGCLMQLKLQANHASWCSLALNLCESPKIILMKYNKVSDKNRNYICLLNINRLTIIMQHKSIRMLFTQKKLVLLRTVHWKVLWGAQMVNLWHRSKHFHLDECMEKAWISNITNFNALLCLDMWIHLLRNSDRLNTSHEHFHWLCLDKPGALVCSNQPIRRWKLMQPAN